MFSGIEFPDWWLGKENQNSGKTLNTENRGRHCGACRRGRQNGSRRTRTTQIALTPWSTGISTSSPTMLQSSWT